MIMNCTILSEITHPMIISKYTQECIQLNYFLKIFSTDYTLESPSNKIEPHYTHRTIENASEMYYNTSPLSQKLYPPCLTMDFQCFLPLINDHSFRHHTPFPPDNDRVCDHYAVLAFPQEKISHYTTVFHPPSQLYMYMMYCNIGTVCFDGLF